MDNLHFDDLTAITAPFGLLDDDTQQRLRDWPHGATFLTANGSWEPWGSVLWYASVTYRARPAPLVPDYVDWSHVAEPFNWHARDKDGRRFFYTSQPQVAGSWWGIIGSVGRLREADAVAGFVLGTVDWRDSLISRPGVDG